VLLNIPANAPTLRNDAIKKIKNRSEKEEGRCEKMLERKYVKVKIERNKGKKRRKQKKTR
jgi:hypothetical protein